MEHTAEPHKQRDASPFFARKDQLDVYEELRVRSFVRNDFIINQVRRDQPGLGLTLPHNRSNTFLASIFFGHWQDYDVWCDERHLRVRNIPSGGLGIVDLRNSWVADLARPFAAVHVYIPLRALTELADDLRAQPVEVLNCPIETPQADSVILHLVGALLPALSRPAEANELFTDYVSAALRMHLAVTYGGMMPPRDRVRGGLTSWQERRAKEVLLDDLRADRSLSEVAQACGLSIRHFAREFKATTGLPPHRWLLRQRIDRAKDLLENTDDGLIKIALDCGFADQSHFTRAFRGMTGISPGAWRKQRRA